MSSIEPMQTQSIQPSASVESISIPTSATEAAPARFPSLASLRAAHGDLLKRHREQGNAPEMLAEIEQFMQKGHATGAVLDNEDDRWTGQGLLDYWSSVLYRAGQVELPEATLVEFDPALVSELSDELCPYLGLEAFHADSQHLFFGRQRLLDKLLTHLRLHRFLIVVGSSGSGKSSVVLGGVLPQLMAGALPGSEDWVYYAPLVPGPDPLIALARKLKPAQVAMDDWLPQQVKAFQEDPSHLLQLVTSAQGSSSHSQPPKSQPVVLFIDQFEEVFTLCRSEEVRDALVQNLLNFIQDGESQNRLMLTMRADFESQFVRLPALFDLFDVAHIRTTAMEATELREAIAQPAALVGLKFEEGLIDALLSDVLGEPAALPLLQFTLLKLWDHRERNRVTWEAYRRLGSGRLALANSADAFYDSLIPEEQVTMKRILLRMVRPGEGLEVTSRRILQSELYHAGEATDRVNRVLAKLIQARLVRPTEGEAADNVQVEVAHEALIRNWPRLVDWLEDERVVLRQRLRLTAAAEQWSNKKRDSSTLLRGLLLEEALSYEELSSLETQFVQASRRAERRAKSLLLLTGAVAIFLLSVTSILALLQAQQARQQAKITGLLEASARSKNLVNTTNATLGLILAIATMEQSQRIDKPAPLLSAISSLLNGLQTAKEENRLQGHTAAVLSVAMSPDGQRIVSAGEDNTVQIWDATTGERLGAPWQGHTGKVWDVAVSPDSQRIVSASEDNTLWIWDAEKGEPIGQPLQGHLGTVFAVAVSPDGQRIVSGSKDKTVLIWDLATGEPMGPPLQGHTDEVFAVAVSPDGQRIVSGSKDGTLWRWDLATGEPIGRPLAGHTGEVFAVAVSPDGQRIVSGSKDKTIRIWNAATGEPIGLPLQGHTDEVWAVAVSPDGERIVSASEDETIRIWDLATGEPIGLPLQGHTDEVWSVAVSPDGQRIVSGSGNEDPTVRIWDASTSALISQGHTDDVLSVAVSPDGQRIVSGGEDHTVRIWDLATGEPIGQPFRGHTEKVWSVAVSPDGQRIVSASKDNTLRIWDAATGKAIGPPLTGHTREVLSVAVSPDGQRIVSGSADKTVRIWDLVSGKLIGQSLEDHERAVLSVAVSPDGERIVSGSADKTVRIWDLATGEPHGEPLEGHTNEVSSVAVSPDGKRIISGSKDRTIRVWDAVTGEPSGQPLQGHKREVWSVAVSPDGKRIISSSLDNTVRIWDVATGEPYGQPLEGHTDSVLSVTISSDGERIVSGSRDSTLRIWDDGTWHSWMRRACERLRYHPLLTATAPESLLSEQKLLDAAKKAKNTCDNYPWLP